LERSQCVNQRSSGTCLVQRAVVTKRIPVTREPEDESENKLGNTFVEESGQELFLSKVKTSTVPIKILGNRGDAAKAKAYIEHLLIGGCRVCQPGMGQELQSAKAWPLPKLVESMTCTWGQCIVSGPALGEAHEQITMFADTARKLPRTTDKVTTHSYQLMYGMHLMPLVQAKEKTKLMEIGLGCDMAYGPGASVALWKTLFPHVDLWEAEFDAACVNRLQAEGRLDGINVVTGDQGNRTTLQRWVQETGGHFDVVIDDGGHQNKQIRASFEELWPHVEPGGLYFLEDLQVGRWTPYDTGGVVMSDMVQAWVEQLLTQEVGGDLPLPEGVQSMFCQAEACVLMKTND